MQESFLSFLGENMQTFLSYTGFANATGGHLIMILVGLLFIFLAIRYEFEPMLLIPIGFNILIIVMKSIVVKSITGRRRPVSGRFLPF